MDVRDKEQVVCRIKAAVASKQFGQEDILCSLVADVITRPTLFVVTCLSLLAPCVKDVLLPSFYCRHASKYAPKTQQILMLIMFALQNFWEEVCAIAQLFRV